MDAPTEKACAGIVCVTAAYIAYVVVTHGDGAVFATCVGIIAALAGYAYGATSPAPPCPPPPATVPASHPDPEEPLLGVK